MIEKLIENWLASAGERGFETPFAQVLAAEGHVVVQGPVHHPFEHGKDIITIAPDGMLHAYQLKGPNPTSLEAFEAIQAQLFALAATAVTHPAIYPPCRADRVFLVTNSALTAPIRDRIDAFNLGNVALGFPPIGLIEKEQLLNRFVATHDRFLPQTLPDIRVLIELYYEDATVPFPIRRFARFLDSVMPLPPESPSRPECKRAIASATLLTAYGASSWQQHENHLCVAQAWLTTCLAILHFAEVHDLEPALWSRSYELALEQARSSLALLCLECSAAVDLVVPDLVDGMVYPSRALLVCGYLGAYLLSEKIMSPSDRLTRDRVHLVLVREREYVKVACESAVPSLLLMARAMELSGEIPHGEGMALSLVASIAGANKRHSSAALADPYHDVEDVLLNHIGDDGDVSTEQFDGRSYMLRPCRATVILTPLRH